MAPSSDTPSTEGRGVAAGTPASPVEPDDRGDLSSDPRRPSDHIDSAPRDDDSGINQPKLSPLGYLRFFWRQLTSMRTALLLLMLLALAAVPGSLVPQITSDPNGVAQYKIDHTTLAPILDKIGLFNTFSTPWFSAVYLLLFVSLIGCIIPRVKHHLEALRSAPPKTPARLQRLAGFQSHDMPASADPAAAPISAEIAVAQAKSVLRRLGYRTRIVGDSVSAERGYARETGNLVFHIALLGILVTVGIGGGFGYTGQRVVVVGQSFSNVLGNYDSFNPGRFFTPSMLKPFNIMVDKFTVKYEEKILNAIGTPIEYKTDVTTTMDGTSKKATIKVNDPLQIGGTNVYLLGNGYAVNVTVRDGEGNIALKDTIPFLPQDSNLTSLGVIKVPDANPTQLGMQGFFYPSAVKQSTGAYASNYPDTLNPLLSLSVYSGDLGLDSGVPQSVYTLETGKLKEIAGTSSAAVEKPITLKPGQTVKLPDGLGSVTFNGVTRFVSLDIHHDPSQLFVLVFAVFIVLGLLTGLFVPRRRVWVKVVQGPDGLQLQYAALARGEDPTLERAVGDLVKRHLAALDPTSASVRRKVNP